MSTMTAQATISAAVEELRVARQETRRDLARVLGVTPPQVTRRMQGAAPWHPDDLDRLAEHFAVPLARLLSAPQQGGRVIHA